MFAPVTQFPRWFFDALLSGGSGRLEGLQDTAYYTIASSVSEPTSIHQMNDSWSVRVEQMNDVNKVASCPDFSLKILLSLQ